MCSKRWRRQIIDVLRKMNAMPVVVTCPTCQKKARVPDAMLGKSVKCPECGATFTVPADGPPPVSPPPTVESAPPEPSSRPLPADADSLHAVRAGAGVQLIAHCLYAAALVAFILLILVSVSGALAVGSGFGGRSTLGSVIPTVLTGSGAVLLVVAGLLNIVGASICVLAPSAQVARGLANAVLVLAVISFLEVTSTTGRMFFFIDDSPSRYGGFGPQIWLTGIVTLWVVEVTRLSVLALFWRAMSRILRDARGRLSRIRRSSARSAPRAVRGGATIGWLRCTKTRRHAVPRAETRAPASS